MKCSMCILLVILLWMLTGCANDNNAGWVCPKCKGGVEAGLTFCSDCGTNMTERAKCSACGYAPENKWPKFCPKCGGTFRNSAIKVGDIVTYGHYEQDNNLNNGEEAIEWIIIDIEDNIATLLSRYGLDQKKYDNNVQNPTWEKSAIRKWLNSDFYQYAFTDDERAGIQKTVVRTEDNSAWKQIADSYKYWDYVYLSGGNDTEDYVYLLSIDEAMNYGGHASCLDFFEKGASTLKMIPTAYAISKDIYLDNDSPKSKLDGIPCGDWWLRSPGSQRNNMAALVDTTGRLTNCEVYCISFCVRPVIKIDMSFLQ